MDNDQKIKSLEKRIEHLETCVVLLTDIVHQHIKDTNTIKKINTYEMIMGKTFDPFSLMKDR